MPKLPVGGNGELPAEAGAVGCILINFRTQDETFPQGARVVVEQVAVTGAEHIEAGGSACSDPNVVDQAVLSCDGFVFEDGSENCGVDVRVLEGAVADETGNIELAGHLDCSTASGLESCLAVGAALNEKPSTGTVTLLEPVPPEPVG